MSNKRFVGYLSGGDSEFYYMDDAAKDRFLFNRIEVPGSRPNEAGWFKDGIIVDGFEFNLNSRFYRSPEFQEGMDVLFTGCSVTFGQGLPEEYIWGTMLSRKLGLSYANLSLPGKSAESLIKNIFAYFKEFGHPKYLFCLFPNPERTTITTNAKILVSKDMEKMSKHFLTKVGYWDVIKDLHLNYYENLEERPKYSKSPYISEDILPIEFAVFKTLSSIQILEQYCEVAGIKLVWGPWDQMFENRYRPYSE